MNERTEPIMTMGSPLISEEERRLLREYRLTTVPSRRSSSCDQQLQQHSQIGSTPPKTPTLITTPNSVASTSPPITITLPPSLLTGPSTPTSTTPTTTSTSTNTTASTTPNLTNSTSTSTGTSTGTSNNHHGAGHHHHQHGHHHHHPKHHSGHHHKMHKSTTLTHELTPSELSQMLALVSELSFLRLVPPTKATCNGTDSSNSSISANGNDRVMKPKTDPGENDNNHHGQQQQKLNERVYLLDDHAKNSSCEPYIFEEVDYIKKLSIRKKRFRKLKKTRSKRVISPVTTESPKIKL